MRLVDVLARLETHEDEATVFVESGPPIDGDSRATVRGLDEADREPPAGFVSLLEIGLMKDVLQVWTAWRGGAQPTSQKNVRRSSTTPATTLTSRHDLDDQMRDVGEEQVFEGIYVAHWEVPRFLVQRGRGWFGRPRIEGWSVVGFPSDFKLPHPEAGDRRGPGRSYRMRVRGRLGPPGQFGHRGFNVRELEVTEVLECVPTNSAGD